MARDMEPAGNFEAWEAQLADTVELTDEPMEVANASSYRMDLLRRAALVGQDITARCVTLGLHGSRQFHELPMEGKKLRVLTEYEHDGVGMPVRLRLTSNMLTDVKVHIYNVDTEDYRYMFGTNGIVARSARLLIHKSPSDLQTGAPPILWKSKQGDMRRFFGKGYSLGAPSALHSHRKNAQIEDRLNTAQRALQVLNLLSREVSLEAEYPYAKDLK